MDLFIILLCKYILKPFDDKYALCYQIKVITKSSL